LLLFFFDRERGKILKKAENTDPPESTQDDSSEPTARIIPLRSETALSRFPIHQLSKKGTIKIRQTRRNQHGKTEVLWEVRNPPGPLGYKLDTAVINRRIDEHRNRGEIPRLIKLGSLGSICEELGFGLGGRTTDQIKEALIENAAALITARLNYRAADGTEEYFEFSSTRYAIILTGQKLPDGRKADAVYIHFHDLYLPLLNRSQTRPLDYEYLLSLPPASQRLYELVSFGVFGALRHGRNQAPMRYSELCATAPLTRYCEWEKVKKQLYKIHKPHIDSGYLKGVEYEQTLDVDGQPDWIIRYTPGPKAKREFREFTKSRAEKREETKPAPRLVSRPTPLAPPGPGTLPSRGPDRAGCEDSVMARRIERLIEAGFTKNGATKLALVYPEACDQQLDALPLRDLSKIPNPAGWLRCAIRDGYSIPIEPEEGSPAALTARETKAAATLVNTEKAKECLFCKDSHVPGHRLVFTEKYPDGIHRPCSHDPEKESAFRTRPYKS
jgi:hypothetical protein